MSTVPFGSNTYVPEASSTLRVSFSRNVEDFEINRFCTLHNVQKQTGYWLKKGADEAVRYTVEGRPMNLWPDGADLPITVYPEHSWIQYNCERYAEGFYVGDLAVEQGSFDVLASHAEDAASKLMTGRTARVYSDLTNTSINTNYSTATAAGGKWSSATATANENYIQKTINYVVRQMGLNTNGRVRRKNIKMIIPEATENALMENAEIRDVVKQSPFAAQYLTAGDIAGVMQAIYGVETIVDYSLKTTNKRGATRAGEAILGDFAIFVARNGGQESTMGGSNLLFYGDEMRVEVSRDMPWQQRSVGSVVENFDHVVVPEYCYLLTDCI